MTQPIEFLDEAAGSNREMPVSYESAGHPTQHWITNGGANIEPVLRDAVNAVANKLESAVFL